MQILVQHGTYQCLACGGVLSFDPCKITEVDHAIGFCGKRCYSFSCPHTRFEDCEFTCKNYGIRMKIPITRLDVEVV